MNVVFTDPPTNPFLNQITTGKSNSIIESAVLQKVNNLPLLRRIRWSREQNGFIRTYSLAFISPFSKPGVEVTTVIVQLHSD